MNNLPRKLVNQLTFAHESDYRGNREFICVMTWVYLARRRFSNSIIIHCIDSVDPNRCWAVDREWVGARVDTAEFKCSAESDFDLGERYALRFVDAKEEGEVLCSSVSEDFRNCVVVRMRRRQASFESTYESSDVIDEERFDYFIERAHPVAPLRDLLRLPLLFPREAETLADFSVSPGSRYSDAKIVEDFFRIARNHLDFVAIRSPIRTLTYRELRNAVARIANELIGAGLVSGQLAVLYMKTSCEAIATMLAAQSVGCVYVPVDPDWPARKVDQILSNSGAAFVLSTPSSPFGPVRDGVRSIVVTLNTEECSLEPCTVEYPEDLAYVMYTSGTTGDPKGVKVSHSAINNITRFTIDLFKHEPGDELVCQSPITFDSSVVKIFPLLMTGGTVILLAENELRDSKAFLDIVDVRHLRWIGATPALIGEIDTDRFDHLESISCGGEVLRYKAIERLIKRHTVYNFYGPTETCVSATVYEVPENNNFVASDIVPIGRPINNYQVYVLDQFQNLQPPGFRGQIAIGGVGVSSGYLNDAGQTAEKFVSNPFLAADRLYLTGDIGAWDPDGNLLFFGRVDDQVKVRGFRIELKEVESICVETARVKEAAAVKSEMNGGMLVCFIVSADDQYRESEFREYLAQNLEPYKIPDLIIELETLPRTSHDKIDKERLLEFIADRFNDEANECKDIVDRLWVRYTGSSESGQTDSFFDVGGTSISALGFITELKKHGYDVPLSEFQDDPTKACVRRTRSVESCSESDLI